MVFDFGLGGGLHCLISLVEFELVEKLHHEPIKKGFIFGAGPRVDPGFFLKGIFEHFLLSVKI